MKNDLAAYLGEVDARLFRACAQKLESSSQKVAIASLGLVDPDDMIQRCSQTLDYALGGLFRGLDQWLSSQMVHLSELASRLQPPETKIAEAQGRLSQFGQRFDQEFANGLTQRWQKLDNLEKLLDANSFERVLDRGFALVTDNDGVSIKRAVAALANASVTIRFADAERGAVLDSGPTDPEKLKKSKSPRLKNLRKQFLDDGQEQLF